MTQENLNKIIGERFRQVREKIGLKQYELAKQLGCGKANISLIETGAIFPNIAIMNQLKNKFNVNLNFLIAGDGPVFNEEKNESFNILDFNEYKGDILTMLNEMKNSKSIMHQVLASFFEIKIVENPSILEKKKNKKTIKK